MRLIPALPLLAAALLAAGCDNQPAKQPTAAATAAPVPPPVDSRDPRRVLVGWAKAVSLKHWDEAYGYWSEGGKGSGLSLTQFRAQWSTLQAPELEISEGKAETAAGSLFYTAPVALVDGPRRIEGKVVLRKSNPAPDATPEQLRWQIDSTTLKF